MRKVISTLLCLAMTFSMTVSLTFAEETHELTKAETVVMNMGIISKDEYSPDDEITRGEFAKIIVDMLRIGDDEREFEEWQNSTKGEDKTMSEMQVRKSVFQDVDESHPYCYEIEMVKRKGYMNGVSQSKFAPEYGITIREATKVLVDLAGYSKQADMNGGYPSGYQIVAREMGLDKNVSGDFSKILTKSELARIIYNAFDVKVMELKLGTDSGTTYEYSDETFLTGVMNMNKLRAKVTDNGFVSISGDSFVAEGKITVGGLELVLPEQFLYAIDYVGQDVEVFYTNDLEEENHVTSIELTDDNVITFDIKDFEKFNDTTISYLKNGKVVTKNINKNAELILNNKFEEIWDKSVFDAPNGTVTLVSKNEKDFDLILVTSYEYAIVSSIDYEDKVIYNRLKGKEISEKYDLSEDVEKGIYIESENGGKLDFSEIEKGDALSIVNSDNYIKIVVKKSPKVSVSFSKIEEENGQKFLTANDTRYALSKFYNKLTTQSDIILAKEYVVYLNSFNEIIFIEVFNEKSKDSESGVLTNAYYDEDEQVRHVKIYGENGKMNRYESYEKIKINGVSKKFEDYVYLLKNSIGSIVLFTTDAEDKITEIVIPESFGDEKELGWYEIASGDNFQYGENKDFNNLFYLNNSTLVYTIPDDKSYYNDEKYFTANSFSFKHSTWYSLKAYARDKNNVVADVIVVEQDVGEGVIQAGRISEEAMFLITEINVGLNEENVPVKKFVGYEFNWRVEKPEYKEYVVAEDAIMIDVGNPGNKIDATKPVEEVGPRTHDELEAGDAIYFGTNIKSELTVMRTAFDYSQKKTFLGGRTSGDAYTYATNTPWYGGAISVSGNGLRIATNAIKNPTGTPKTPDKIDYTDFAEVSEHVCSFIMVPSKIVVVEEVKKGKFTARTGSADDIITYMDAGTYDNVLVSTNWRSNLYATVIYK